MKRSSAQLARSQRSWRASEKDSRFFLLRPRNRSIAFISTTTFSSDNYHHAINLRVRSLRFAPFFLLSPRSLPMKPAFRTVGELDRSVIRESGQQKTRDKIPRLSLFKFENN